MRTIAGLFLTTLLAMSAGCAQTDWIDRTLVTVDVTGAWIGQDQSTGVATLTADVFLELVQEGSTVKGSIRSKSQVGLIRGEIDGTVAGDVFRFRATRGDAEGEMRVNGDVMTGQMAWGSMGGRPISLRRVDSSSPPASPPR